MSFFDFLGLRAPAFPDESVLRIAAQRGTRGREVAGAGVVIAAAEEEAGPGRDRAAACAPLVLAGAVKVPAADEVAGADIFCSRKGATSEQRGQYKIREGASDEKGNSRDH